MVTPDPVDLNNPADILVYMDSGLRALRDAIDHGASYADLVLNGHPADSHFWAHCVRYHAANRLAEAQPGEWRLQKLANSGIIVARDPLIARVLKTQSAGPPHPGHSEARQRYWSQQLTLTLNWNGVTEPAVGAHLIVDWTIDKNREVVLALSKPIGVWRYTAAPRLEWRRAVIFDEREVRFDPAEEDVFLEPRYEDFEGLDEPEVG